MRRFVLFLLLLVSAQANAAQFWSGDFQITNLYVSLAENLHYRIYGMPAVADCPTGIAYLNESDSGAKGKIAAILMAYSTGKPIRVFAETPPGGFANGYCHIVEIFISG